LRRRKRGRPGAGDRAHALLLRGSNARERGRRGNRLQKLPARLKGGSHAADPRTIAPDGSSSAILAGMHRTTSALAVAAMALATAAGQPLAQPRNTAAIQVRETAGIARTQYPVSARVRVPRGALTDPARARLLEKTADVPAQFSSESSWDDGSRSEERRVGKERPSQ
jgi:hypothetical protein